METTAVNNVTKESFLSADDNNAAVILLVEKACEQYQHCFYKKTPCNQRYKSFFSYYISIQDFHHKPLCIHQ